MLGFNMLNHQVCEFWSLLESVFQYGLEEIYSLGHPFSSLEVLVWHPAGCQPCPLQQPAMAWPQLCSIISSMIAVWELLLWVCRHPCLHYVLLNPSFLCHAEAERVYKAEDSPSVLLPVPRAGIFGPEESSVPAVPQLPQTSFVVCEMQFFCDAVSLCMRLWWFTTEADWQNIIKGTQSREWASM